MDIKIKFIDGGLNEDRESFAIVKLNTGKTFNGKAKCHPDDFCSKYSGCKIAEIRAVRKAYKFLLKQEKKELHKLENFVKAVECYKDFDEKSKTARCIYRQLNRHKKNIKSLINAITTNEKHEKEYIANLDKLNQKEKAKED